MSLLLSALTIGFILSLLALGVYISFRIFEFPDITAEGSITLGAAVCAVLLVHGWPPLVATFARSEPVISIVAPGLICRPPIHAPDVALCGRLAVVSCIAVDGTPESVTNAA